MVVVLALGVLLGNLMVYGLPGACHHFFLISGVIFLFTLLTFGARHRWSLIPLMLFLFGILGGFLRTGWDQHVYLQSRLPDSITPFIVTLTGVIAQITAQTPQRTTFIFIPDQIDHASAQAVKRIQLTWLHAPTNLRASQRWQLATRIQLLHALMNLGGAVHSRFFMQDVHAKGIVLIRSPPNQLKSSLWQGKLNALRDHLAAMLQAHHFKFSGVLSALAVGNTSNIPTEHWEVFRRTGTAHLLAISGLHIGLSATATASVATWLWRRYPRGCQRFPAVMVGKLVGLFFACLYCACAGFAIATLRALLMLLLWSGASLLHRRYLLPEPLALSLIGCIILTPRATLQPGFWLSFLAVALLLSVSHGQFWRHTTWVRQWRSQKQLYWGMIPLGVIFFQHYATYSPLANLISIPWFSIFVVPFTLLGTILGLISPLLGSFLLMLANLCLHLIWPLLHWLSVRSFAYIQWTFYSAWAGFALILGLLLICLPRGLPGRSLGWLLFCSQFFEPQPRPHAGEFWLRLLDVGQGLSAVVHTQHHTLLYDTGGRFGELDSGRQVIWPYLQRMRVTALNAVVISHPDMDHRGGFPSVVASLPVMRVFSSFPDKWGLKPTQNCHTTPPWMWDGVQFSFLALPQDNSTNNRSCVLRVSSSYGAALLPGDIEAKAEQWLVEHSKAALRADLLIAPHHGSRTSSSYAFIKAVQPKVVWYATGFQNRYGFPHSEVVKRYEKQGVSGYNTAFNGMLRATITRRGWAILPPLRNPKYCSV